MGWNLGRYYTRSKKVNGRIYREYVGGGETGLLAAQLDQAQREMRMQRREATKCLMSDLKAITLEKFQLRRQDSANRRYMAAIRTLATVRKMALPALQINVGQNQINLTRDAEVNSLQIQFYVREARILSHHGNQITLRSEE